MNNNFFYLPSVPESPSADISKQDIAAETFFPLTILDPYGNILNYEMKKCCKKYKKGKRCKSCPKQ